MLDNFSFSRFLKETSMCDKCELYSRLLEEVSAPTSEDDLWGQAIVVGLKGYFSEPVAKEWVDGLSAEKREELISLALIEEWFLMDLLEDLEKFIDPTDSVWLAQFQHVALKRVLFGCVLVVIETMGRLEEFVSGVTAIDWRGQALVDSFTDSTPENERLRRTLN